MKNQNIQLQFGRIKAGYDSSIKQKRSNLQADLFLDDKIVPGFCNKPFPLCSWKKQNLLLEGISSERLKIKYCKA